MDILKTPHEKLLEEAGITPQSPGMLNTPKQLLMQESGIMSRFADGGNVQQPNLSSLGQNAPWLFGQNAAPEYPQFNQPPQQPQPQTYAQGGGVQMSPQDMLASLVASGHLPAHYAPGGLVKNIAGQAAWNLPTMGEELQDIGADIGKGDYTPAALKTAGAAYSAFAPINPLSALISGVTYSPEAGAGSTLDEWKAEQEAAKNPPKREATAPKKRSSLYHKTMVPNK